MSKVGLRISSAGRSARNGDRLRRLLGIAVILAALPLGGCNSSSLFEATPSGPVNLQGLLQAHPTGGREMARRAALSVAQDPDKAIFLANISRNANEMQQAAIGAALHDAARAIAGTNPRGRTEILTALARSPKAVRAAFLASSLND